jgi:hypothetical protein
MLETSSFGERAEQVGMAKLARGNTPASIPPVVALVANPVYVVTLSAAALFAIGKIARNRKVGGMDLADPARAGPPRVVMRGTG